MLPWKVSLRISKVSRRFRSSKRRNKEKEFPGQDKGRQTENQVIHRDTKTKFMSTGDYEGIGTRVQ